MMRAMMMMVVVAWVMTVWTMMMIMVMNLRENFNVLESFTSSKYFDDYKENKLKR